MPPTAPRMPVVFIGHGSPMNAISDNRWSRGFRALAAALPKPRAIVAVSAHWWGAGTFVTSQAAPPTIHDFGGFPPALHAVQYPAPGDPQLAARITDLLGDQQATPTDQWGLDHGTWSVLVHMFAPRDQPVVQVSIDAHLPPAQQLAIGAALAPLRDEGVLLLASGNVVHNLRHAIGHLHDPTAATPPWASRFDDAVANALAHHDDALLADALATSDGRQAHPTPDHFQPLLYAAGAADPADRVTFPIDGFDAGSLSMRAVRFG